MFPINSIIIPLLCLTTNLVFALLFYVWYFRRQLKKRTQRRKLVVKYI